MAKSWAVNCDWGLEFTLSQCQRYNWWCPSCSHERQGLIVDFKTAFGSASPNNFGRSQRNYSKKWGTTEGICGEAGRLLRITIHFINGDFWSNMQLKGMAVQEDPQLHSLWEISISRIGQACWHSIWRGCSHLLSSTGAFTKLAIMVWHLKLG